MIESLLAGLNNRISRFLQSRDPSEVLDPAALEEARRLWEAARPADDDLRAVSVNVLTSLAYFHLSRHMVLPEGRDQDDLNIALSFFSVLVEHSPERVPPNVRQTLASIQLQSASETDKFAAEGAQALAEFQRTGRPELLNAVVTAFQKAVAATHADHPALGGRLSDLGVSYLTRFERFGNPTDLDSATEAGRQAVAITPDGHPWHALRLSNYGNSLRARFEHSGGPADLDHAIDVTRQAVEATPAGHPQLATYLSNLGNCLRTRFEHFGNDADLDDAVNVGRRAVDLASSGDPGLVEMLSNLSGALEARFKYSGNVADIDAAIDAARQAVADAAPNHPNRLGLLSNLGTALFYRFERTGDSSDIEAAHDALQQAAEATPIGHPRYAERLSKLAMVLRTQFEQDGDDANLDAAIDIARQAVDNTQPGHASRPSHLSNLGTCHLDRFSLKGDAGDLDDAIDAIRQAVNATHSGAPQLARMLSNLGVAFRTRFDHFGDPADLDSAVEYGRRAVDVTTPSHPQFATALSNLVNALRARFEHLGNNEDLDAAITAGRHAVDALPQDHPQLAAVLSTLGPALAVRFELLGETTDLDAAVEVGRRAVSALSPGHPKLAGALSNQGNYLLARFKHFRNIEDLGMAIDAGRRAVEATPQVHPDLSLHWYNLAHSLVVQFENTQATADLDDAISYLQRAAELPTGTPKVRLIAAGSWGSVAARNGRMHAAAEGYAAAVGLLPEVAWHGLNRETREQQLMQWTGLAADAAACCILDGSPGRAVELLEQGRSILWTNALNLRTDLTNLAEKAPNLAERLDTIRRIIDAPAPEGTLIEPDTAEASPSRVGRDREQEDMDLRRRMTREWDDVLAQVREIAGFEHFLAATPYADLATAAIDGPVVVINASSYGCHALIIESNSGRPRIVNLTTLSIESAAKQVNLMLGALAGSAEPGRDFRDREERRHAVLDVLGWVWDVIAEPVLSTLGYSSTPEMDTMWPRIWWCPIGVLSLLPIHSAGHYPRLRMVAGNAHTVPDRVVSSYTPTLDALIRSREPLTPAASRQLIIGMPTTPGLAPLPAVPEEMEILGRYFPPQNGATTLLIGAQATQAAVLAAINTCSWTHFACHASQKQTDPDRSGFALWDTTLTITDLAALPTKRRDLAFLSACQTATGSIRHLDEAIHLAAAMQFLGYRHVIATMWTIADSPAPSIADTVYGLLANSGELDSRRAAEAVHRAMQSLRQADPTNPLLWGPYIHIGP